MANKKSTIRQAKPTDAFFLLPLMKAFLAEVSAKYPPVDDADCLNWMLSVINQGGAWVAISDKKIVGSIGCGVDFFAWNRKHVNVFDEWYYVKPEFRKGTSVASDLLKVAKGHAKVAGLPFIFSINSGKDKRIDRFVQMHGFEYLGGIAVSWPGDSDGEEKRINADIEQKS
jgi:hypothetical protein